MLSSAAQMRPPPSRPSLSRFARVAISLEIFLSVGALGGGGALMVGPRGEIIPLPRIGLALVAHATQQTRQLGPADRDRGHHRADRRPRPLAAALERLLGRGPRPVQGPAALAPIRQLRDPDVPAHLAELEHD